ncbi:fluoride efflux transporter CrcB [Dickeya undicola]|uniref:Fluoride-specific ion channel FluC n=1 Tax=Dickeya undicola TaxID=1577887 RepID=A0A3N0G189_9GAMM|nr:fluoride efflux transporter CrcB [Dickeya undicola]RNM06129.1 fluoride efflux transporter CrcB [Dickeya undicola]RNM28694.1 fluoride efflux transporter CrcB [Dickeya undicola]
MYSTLLAVFIGGGIGSVARWQLSVRFNTLFPQIPAGTLLANLLGAFVIGAAMSYFIRQPDLPPQWKMLLTTGFCGGLTTFSTFSYETVTLLQSGEWTAALFNLLLNLLGSLIMTALAFALVGWLSAH